MTDAHGCTNQDEAYVFEPSPISVSAYLLDSVDCLGNATGKAYAIAQGGVGNYTYVWETGVIGDSLLMVSSGTYSVSVADSNYCSTVDSIFINEPALLVLSLDSLKNARCKDELSGFLSVTASGGNLSYQYVWSTTSTQAFIDSLSDGNYTVTVTDLRGCQDSLSLNISEPDSLLTSIAYTDTLVCQYDGDGQLTSVTTGGTLPYAYQWNNAVNSVSNSNLSDGIYRVTVTDIQGCQDSSEFALSALSHLTSQIDSVYDILCYQDQSGFVLASADSGAGNYSWSWNSGHTTDSAYALDGGNYFYTVTDSLGCVDSGNAFVFEPTQLVLSIDSVSEIMCFGDDDGEIYTSASDGTSPYTWAWSNTATSDSVIGLDSGMYVVTLTDANGCQVVDSTLIMEPAAPLSVIFNVTDANCLGGATGSVSAAVSGGTSGYQYSWNNGENGSNIDTLFTGWYYLTVTDAHACVLVDSAFVDEPIAPDTALISTIDVQCKGYMNGSVSANFYNGISPYSYSWSNGSTDTAIYNLDSGIYSVTIIDSLGCTQFAQATVLEPDTLWIQLSEFAPILCHGDSSATITFGFMDVGNGIAHVIWDSGDTATTFISYNNPSGVYSIKVIDLKGCVDFDTITITEPTQLEIDSLYIGEVSCNGLSDAQGFVSVIGGTPNYSYAWTSGSITNQTNYLNAGIHSVTIADANGCLIDSVFTVSQPDSLIVSISIDINPNCDNTSDGQLSAYSVGGNGGNQLIWNIGSTDSIINQLEYGVYSVSITDSLGCSDSAMVNLEYLHLKQDVELGPDQIFCDGDSVTLAISEDFAQINWSTGSASSTVSIDETNIYTVDVIDTNGCGNADTILIEKKFETSFTLGADTVMCTDLGFVSLTLQAPGFESVIWSTGATTSSIIVNSSNLYSALATNEFGCVSSDSIQVDFDECLDPMVYPIPTLTEVHIVWPKIIYSNLQFNLVAMNGQVVDHFEFEPAIEHKISLENQSSGVYYLNVIGDDFMLQYRLVKL